MLFSVPSSSFVALFLLPSTLCAVQGHSGLVGACFPAIRQDQLAMAAMTWCWGTYLAPFPSLFCLFLLSCSFSLRCIRFIGAWLLLLMLAGLVASVRGPTFAGGRCVTYTATAIGGLGGGSRTCARGHHDS